MSEKITVKGASTHPSGHWRAGIKWTSKPESHEVTEAQLEELKRDPRIVLLQGAAAGTEAGKEAIITELTRRTTELEAQVKAERDRADKAEQDLKRRGGR